MAKARYYKSLFIPPLEGQQRIWKNDIANIAQGMDEIIQLGNLIGCYDTVKDGEKTGGNLYTLRYIMLWRATFSHWTQLVGPNEIMALNFPDEWTNLESNGILRQKWFDKDDPGRFNTAAVNKGRLVTHGGLTYGQWVEIGRPQTAQEAADALNEKFNQSLYQGECFRLNGKPSFWANPIFADPVREVYPSWITAPESPPFHQLHSGGGLNTRDGRAAMYERFSFMQFIDYSSYTNFGGMVRIKGKNFYSVFHDIKRETNLSKIPSPWQLYIEKMPVIDTRDEIFKEIDKQRASALKGEKTRRRNAGLSEE